MVGRTSIGSDSCQLSDGTSFFVNGINSGIGRLGIAAGKKLKNGTRWYARVFLPRNSTLGCAETAKR